MTDELAKKLEDAQVGSRELDALLEEALFGTPRVLSMEINPQPLDAQGNYLSLYTTSLGAAVGLVERAAPHISFELTRSAAGPPHFARARLWDWRRGPKMADPHNEWIAEGNRTPALTLCLALLRAREQGSAGE